MDILLIQPPALKPSEPPLGLAVLLGHLRASGLESGAIDANLDALLWLLDAGRLRTAAGERPSTPVQRALNHRDRALAQLRSTGAVRSPERYRQAVLDLNRLLGLYGSGDEQLTLGDYRHGSLSPFSPAALEHLAQGEAATLFAGYFARRLLPQIEALQPRCVALSINYLHQAQPGFELAGLLRRRFPQLQLVAGGGLITSWQQALAGKQPPYPFDRLVFGPGEEPLAALAAGREPRPDSPALRFIPDYSFARFAEYLSPAPVLPVSTSRGCYWQRCLFCPEAATPVHPYAAFDPQALPRQLAELAAACGVRHLHLTDNAVPVAALRALAAAPEAMQGLSWYGFVRFEKALEDPGFVNALAKSGCRMLQLGLESGSQPVLDRLGKGIRLDAAARILANLHAAGIASYVYIMLGTPGETAEDAVLTRDFLQRHAAHIGYLNLAIMNLPRDSKLLHEPAAFGIAATETIAADQPLSLYRRFHGSSDWNRASARRFLDRELLAVPAIRAIERRTPPLFTSSHACFFPLPK